MSIKTFNTYEFVERNMHPNPRLQDMLRKDYGRFFIVPVQDMIRVSKLPVPPTRATTHTIIYLTSGVATMKVGSQQIIIHENECLVVPAGQVFCYEKYEINTGFITNFDNDFLIGKFGNQTLLQAFEFLKIWGNPVIRPELQRATYLQQSFQRILDEYQASGLKNATIIQSYLLACLCDLNAAYHPLSNHHNKGAIALTNRFKDLLYTHIRQKHLASDYAALLHITPNHLNKVVKEITGKPVSKWIDEILMLEAKVLLFQTNQTINQVAAELGIFDASYFSRFFRKYEGVTPAEFRKMIEKS